ncbi:MAG: orotidine-5'-phosphate decarboxylase, partial [Alphaproteobacteria bacterium]
MAGASFGTRLAAAIRSSGTPLCMGIDPHPGMVPALFGNSTEPGHPDTIRAISDFTMACLAAAKGRVAAIKPQAAFFEAQGPDGMRVLAELGRSAVDAGMLVIMDAKRNDIGSTNAAYAEAWIGHDAPFPSDALTVNAFLGLDTLEPLLARADAVG